ncbi:Calpain [Hondaea fermentalgiana]|uniref:Calpain n=1 Tax=Hondaea fermentalgiana TaxID=2315210 RepID=A0A2R5FZ56_9STRA|nr:Calpain [Hondaea fermentalgiana]|eukprot:GBG24010.1 Calpain [Hondaea fermentalgiana]
MTSHWTIVRVGALKIDRYTDLSAAWDRAEQEVTTAVQKVIDRCERKGGERFVDNFFGPKKQDPDGASSFYGDGKAPNGNYANPAQCEWVRPRWARDCKAVDLGAKVDEESDIDMSDQDSVASDATQEEDAEENGFDPTSLSGSSRSFCDEGALFLDGVSANDVIQGRLGDCWLLSGMSVLASRPDLLAKVFWKSTSVGFERKMRKYGFRVCRFFKDHEWFFVIIDDRLPIFAKSGKPVFAHCKDRNELWVSLLEKAYAKLHGSYDALIGGYVDGALRDLTGLACEELVLREGHTGFHPKYAAWIRDGTLWNRCNEYANEWGCMMGCSIQPDPRDLKAGKVEQKVGDTGLMSRHAYALIDVGLVRTKDDGDVKLVRLRNPWGFGEWTGPWSDESPEFKRNLKALQNVFDRPICERKGVPSTILPVNGNARDGTFFMTWEDWTRYFTVFFAAIDFPDKWAGQRVTGAWTTKHSNAGGNHTCKTWMSNPKHRFRVLEPDSRIYIQLNQEDPRRKAGRAQAQMQQPLSFHILSLGDMQAGEVAKPPAKIPGTDDREQAPYKRHLSIDIDIPRLAKGDYVIVPSTFAPGAECKYTLQVYGSRPIALENGELIAEEEEYGVVEHIQVDFRRNSLPSKPASRRDLGALYAFEERRAELVERAKCQRVSMAALASSMTNAGNGRIDWTTWEQTMRSLGLEAIRAEFDAFSGSDSIIDAQELSRLVDAENVERQINGMQGDEAFADSVQGDEAAPRFSSGSSSAKMDESFTQTSAQKELLCGLVNAAKSLQRENDGLRAELQTVREEQARMMNVLLLYGKMLKCYDGEVLKPEALLKPVSTRPSPRPNLDALLRAATSASSVTRRTTVSNLQFSEDEFAGAGDEFLAVKPWKGAIFPPSHPPKSASSLQHTVDLDWVYGFNAKIRNAVFVNAENSLVYIAAALGVIYNPSTHTQKYFRAHTDDISCIDVDVSGRRVVTGQLGKKPFACVWDALTGELVCRLDDFEHKREITCVKFSSDGTEVLTVGGDDNHSLALYCASSGKLRKHAKGNKADCYFAHHNGDRFVTGGKKYMVFLDAQLKDKRAIFGQKGGAPAVVLCASRLADENDVLAGQEASFLLATGTADGRILLWSKEGKCVEAAEHGGGKDGKAPVKAIAFKNGHLYSGASDGSVKRWVLRGKRLEEDYEDEAATSTKFSSAVQAFAGEYIALGEGSIIAKNDETPVVVGHSSGELWGLAAHPASRCVVTTGDDQMLRVWNTKAFTQERSTKLPSGCRAAAWSHDGATLALGLVDNLVMLLDGATLKKKVTANLSVSKKTSNSRANARRGKARMPHISCLAFCRNNDFLAAGSNDTNVYVLDAKTLRKVYVCKASTATVTHIDFSACSTYLRTNDASYELLFYNVRTKSQRTSASSLKDMEWETTNCPLAWETQGVWPPEADGTDINACVRFSLTNDPAAPSLLATSDDLGKVNLYPYPFPERDETQVAFGEGHASHVTNVAYAGEDKLVSTGGNDCTLIQWQLVDSTRRVG